MRLLAFRSSKHESTRTKQFLQNCTLLEIFVYHLICCEVVYQMRGKILKGVVYKV